VDPTLRVGHDNGIADAAEHIPEPLRAFNCLLKLGSACQCQAQNRANLSRAKRFKQNACRREGLEGLCNSFRQRFREYQNEGDRAALLQGGERRSKLGISPEDGDDASRGAVPALLRKLLKLHRRGKPVARLAQVPQRCSTGASVSTHWLQDRLHELARLLHATYRRFAVWL
jgi:hypothetical protein